MTPGPAGEGAPASAGSRTHLPVLDGLRGVAVLLVLWHHVPESLYSLNWRLFKLAFEPGYLGVDVFFVLSGFLITRILLWEKRGGRPVRRFLLRRLLRIFPIYYLLLALVWFLRPGPELPWCAAYLANFYFPFHPIASPLSHTWSLSVEEHFYLLWPFVLHLLPRRLERLVPLALFLPIALASAVWVTSSSAWRADPNGALAFTQSGSMFRFASLALGCQLAFLEPWIAARPRAALGLAAALFVPGYLFSGVNLGLLQLHAGFPPPPMHAVPAIKLFSFALISTALVLAGVAARGEGRSPAALLRAGTLRGVGRISYGLYLYHYPIYFWLFHAEGAPPPTWARVALAVALSFAAAALSYAAIERPILRYAKRYR